jgi:thiol-disulfide isomerase/thioredoxin
MNSRLLVGIFVLAGIAGAAAYYVTTKPGAMTPPSATTDATREPATGADAASESAPGAVQLAATIPAFQLADQDGVMRSLKDDWAGKALIVNFWATWCAPCRREIPLLKQLAADHAGENFQVIGIAVDFRDKVLTYAKEMQIDYPMLIGEQEALDAAAAFGVDALGLPFTIFTDTGGRVITLHMGELTAAEADIILGAVREVNAGRSDPAQARAVIEAGLAALPPSHDSEGA